MSRSDQNLRGDTTFLVEAEVTCVESHESKVDASSQDPDAINSDTAISDVDAEWTIVKRRRRRQ
jgi:hypothetical protein